MSLIITTDPVQISSLSGPLVRISRRAFGLNHFLVEIANVLSKFCRHIRTWLSVIQCSTTRSTHGRHCCLTAQIGPSAGTVFRITRHGVRNTIFANSSQERTLCNSSSNLRNGIIITIKNKLIWSYLLISTRMWAYFI